MLGDRAARTAALAHTDFSQEAAGVATAVLTARSPSIQAALIDFDSLEQLY